MTREEDLVRSTTHAIASTVHEVPPLQLEPATDELRSPARAPRGARRGSGRRRHWWSWAAPLAAAAVVVALAITLALVKNNPNGGAVPENPAQSTAGLGGSTAGLGGSTAGLGGAPRYFVALKYLAVNTAAELAGRFQYSIVVEDSLTGKTLATFAPPANTTFQNVTAAADDRTFVVFAVTSSTGSFDPSPKGGTLTGSWYEVRLDPGTAHPASLTRLPVKPQSWAGEDNRSTPGPGEIFATALSQSGRELAVADIPDVPAAHAKPQDWQEVKVFSVATGRLLHDWTGNDPTARFVGVMSSTMAGVPEGTPALTWIDGDRALALATSYQKSGKVTGTVRRLNVAGPASGNLMTDSTVIWSGTLPWGQSGVCLDVNDWPPLISADGKTISCVTIDMPNATPGHVDFVTAPLTAGTAAGVKPRLDYRATIPPEKQTGGIDTGILWISPSAGTLIVDLVPGGNLSPPKSAYFGVVSHGKYIPLPLPKSLAASTVMDITF